MIKLSSVTVNCPDTHQLAEFYATITGGEVTFQQPSWATVMSPGGPHRPPEGVGLRAAGVAWSGSRRTDSSRPLLVDDLAETEVLVLQAGATKFEEQPNVEHCLVFADPAGHPFCLTTVDELG